MKRNSRGNPTDFFEKNPVGAFPLTVNRFGSFVAGSMDELFTQFRDKTALSAPPELSAAVVAGLGGNRLRAPSLFLLLGSSSGLAAAIAFTLTTVASKDRVHPPSANSLLGGAGVEILAIRP